MYSYNNEIQTKYVQVVSYKDKLTTSKKNWRKTKFSDIRIGDEIIIYFGTDSQEYICNLYPKFGQVVRIELDIKSSNNFNSEQTLKHLTLKYDDIEYNASHAECSLDYSFEIYRLDDIISEPNSEPNSENMKINYDLLEYDYDESLEYDSGYDSFG